MENTEVRLTPPARKPLAEFLKSIPSVIGIRLNEKPDYKLLRRENNFELRKYSPFIIAQTTISGAQEYAFHQGTLKLTEFMFGNNFSNTQLHMTTPVFQEKTPQINLGAPLFNLHGEEEWTVSYIMPKNYSLKSLPRPIDHSISFTELPERIVAVVEYQGLNHECRMMQVRDQLHIWLGSMKARIDSVTRWAQYSAPFTAAPFLAKHEAQVDVII